MDRTHTVEEAIPKMAEVCLTAGACTARNNALDNILARNSTDSFNKEDTLDGMAFTRIGTRDLSSSSLTELWKFPLR
jgi:hypothetical protein